MGSQLIQSTRLSLFVCLYVYTFRDWLKIMDDWATTLHVCLCSQLLMNCFKLWLFRCCARMAYDCQLLNQCVDVHINLIMMKLLKQSNSHDMWKHYRTYMCTRLILTKSSCMYCNSMLVCVELISFWIEYVCIWTKRLKYMHLWLAVQQLSGRNMSWLVRKLVHNQSRYLMCSSTVHVHVTDSDRDWCLNDVFRRSCKSLSLYLVWRSLMCVSWLLCYIMLAVKMGT